MVYMVLGVGREGEPVKPWGGGEPYEAEAKWRGGVDTPLYVHCHFGSRPQGSFFFCIEALSKWMADGGGTAYFSDVFASVMEEMEAERRADAVQRWRCLRRVGVHRTSPESSHAKPEGLLGRSATCAQ